MHKKLLSVQIFCFLSGIIWIVKTSELNERIVYYLYFCGCPNSRWLHDIKTFHLTRIHYSERELYGCSLDTQDLSSCTALTKWCVCVCVCVCMYLSVCVGVWEGEWVGVGIGRGKGLGDVCVFVKYAWFCVGGGSELSHVWKQKVFSLKPKECKEREGEEKRSRGVENLKSILHL